MAALAAPAAAAAIAERIRNKETAGWENPAGRVHLVQWKQSGFGAGSCV